jgi:hypothetical protein
MPADAWYIPDFAHWGGVNDRLAFGTYAAMRQYGHMAGRCMLTLSNPR